MTAKTYDSKCYDLACDFLEGGEPALDTAHYRELLAKEIQQTIEVFIAGAMKDYESPYDYVRDDQNFDADREDLMFSRGRGRD